MIAYAAALLAFAVGGYLLVGNPLDPFDDRRFSPTAWRRSDEDGKARMTRSAIRQLVPGLPEKQAVAMLGPPDEVLQIEDDGGHKLPGARTYSYGIGSWSGYGFDDAYLYVHLDSTDRVLSAEVNGY